MDRVGGSIFVLAPAGIGAMVDGSNRRWSSFGLPVLNMTRLRCAEFGSREMRQKLRTLPSWKAILKQSLSSLWKITGKIGSKSPGDIKDGNCLPVLHSHENLLYAACTRSIYIETKPFSIDVEMTT